VAKFTSRYYSPPPTHGHFQSANTPLPVRSRSRIQKSSLTSSTSYTTIPFLHLSSSFGSSLNYSRAGFFTSNFVKTNKTDNHQCGGGGKQKSQDQISEEELHELQSHFRTHYAHANYEAALETAEKILEQSAKLFKTDHPATASAHNNLGLIHKHIGKYDESEKFYLEALAIYERILGKDHASYAAALHNLGSLMRMKAQLMSPQQKEEGDDVDDEEDFSEIEEKTQGEIIKLLELAIEYFEEAWNIRKVELGDAHVHTVGTRSQLGSAISAKIIQGEMLSKLKHFQQTKGKNEMTATNEESSQAKEEDMTVATSNSYDDGVRWDVAEEHLRSALHTAINNPRGKQIEPLASASQKEQQNKNNNIPPRRDKTRSKKEQRKVTKERKKILREAGRSDIATSTNENETGMLPIKTLSAASAAQNLAVFLKNRAGLISSSSVLSNNVQTITQDVGDMYAEAKNLYLGAIHVRKQVKGEQHPDTIASKFSLAELIDLLGDEKGAHALRREILDVYDIELKNDEEGKQKIE